MYYNILCTKKLSCIFVAIENEFSVCSVCSAYHVVRTPHLCSNRANYFVMWLECQVILKVLGDVLQKKEITVSNQVYVA